MRNSTEEIQQIKKELSVHYEMTDLGEIQSYLGICIVCNRVNKHIDIDQSDYIQSKLKQFNLEDANPHPTPLPTSALDQLVKNTGEVSLEER